MFLMAHSFLRYPLYALGLAAIGYAVYGAATRRPFDETMRKLGSWLALIMLAEILVGLGLLFTGRFSPTALTGHVFSMVGATAVAFVVPVVMRKRPSEERTWMPYIAGAVVSLALVWLGLRALGLSVFGGVG